MACEAGRAGVAARHGDDDEVSVSCHHSCVGWSREVVGETTEGGVAIRNPKTENSVIFEMFFVLHVRRRQ